MPKGVVPCLRTVECSVFDACFGTAHRICQRTDLATPREGGIAEPESAQLSLF